MLTRGQVAKRLGKSIATVRRLEGVELHPQRDAGGVLRFDAREVQRVATRMRHSQHGQSIGLSARSDRFSAARDADDLEQDDLEDREHRERLRLREEERRAYDEQRRREREERLRREEEQIRTEAEAARLDALRSRV